MPEQRKCSVCGNVPKRPFAVRSPAVCRACYSKSRHKKETCFCCGRLWWVAKRQDGKPICRKCAWRQYSRPTGVCLLCGKEAEIHSRTSDGHPVCGRCHARPKAKCSSCGRVRRINSRNSGRPICASCYVAPEATCVECGLVRPIHGNGKCASCYRTPKEKCGKCGKIKAVHVRKKGKPLCITCYDPPKRACSACGKVRMLKTRGISELCPSCYCKRREEADPALKVIRRLRVRLRHAFRSYSEHGKVKKSDEYGIDYRAICEHLGSCPGKWGDWHIDHIVPLSFFDFDDPEQIKKAFAPENHRWVTAAENLKKGAKMP